MDNEDVVRASPVGTTGDAPTACEWSTILLPAMLRLILEFWWYTIHYHAITSYLSVVKTVYITPMLGLLQYSISLWPKLSLNASLTKYHLPRTYFSVAESFWNFAQSMPTGVTAMLCTKFQNDSAKERNVTDWQNFVSFKFFKKTFTVEGEVTKALFINFSICKVMS